MKSSADTISLKEYRSLVMAKSGQMVKAVRPPRRKNEEELLQIACMEWVLLNIARYPILKWLVHVPNGGKRPKGEAGKLKAMGTKKGFPDLYLPRRMGPWAGFVMELKSADGVVSADQQDWLDMFDQEGCMVSVGRSLEFFIARMTEFLNAGNATRFATDRLQSNLKN